MTENQELKNAVIESTMFGYEDHGILSSFLYLDYGGSGQGFGGFGLDSYSKEKDKRIAHKACGHFIMRVLEITKKRTWESLPGTPIRVVASTDKVYAIGNHLDDRWFWPDEEFKKMRKGE